MSIEISNINKRFGSFQALREINLDIHSGELIALLGPSGCGKTTLLRIIAGLETADSGSLFFSGEDSTDKQVRDRQVGFVFQHYALFRHMTVFDNVAFGLRIKPRKERPSAAAIKDKVLSLLKLVQLDWLADRYPTQLSGGQRQRIALARALAVEPQVLLLDEPFGALDAKVRKELRRWLRRLHDELHVTSIFVTHDQEEALEVADRVVLMNHGVIEQVGTPEQVYQSPASAFVYGFLGSVNVFHGRVEGSELQVDQIRAAHELPQPADEGSAATAYARPHELAISRSGGAGIAATVERIHGFGGTAHVDLVSDGSAGVPALLEVELQRDELAELALRVGDTVRVHPRQWRVFIRPIQGETTSPTVSETL